MKHCTYCGVPAETIDHTIPKCVVKAAGDAGINLSSLSRIRYLTVHACGECNSALGSRIFPTLSERRDAAKAHIRRKYACYLKMPNWTEDELADMGPIAQHDIRLGLARKEWAKARLAWTGTNEAAPDFAESWRLSLAAARVRIGKRHPK